MSAFVKFDVLLDVMLLAASVHQPSWLRAASPKPLLNFKYWLNPCLPLSVLPTTFVYQLALDAASGGVRGRRVQADPPRIGTALHYADGGSEEQEAHGFA